MARWYNEVIRYCIEVRGVSANDGFPHLMMTSTPVPDLVHDDRRRRDVLAMIRSDLAALEATGADFLAIACNTVHTFFDELAEQRRVPLLNMIDLTANTVLEAQPQSVLVLATPTSMQQGLYASTLEKCGLQVALPPRSDWDRLGEVISRLVGGQDTSDDRAWVRLLVHPHIDVVVLGCTELGFAFEDRDHEHAVAIVEPLAVLAQQVADLCLNPTDQSAQALDRHAAIRQEFK